MDNEIFMDELIELNPEQEKIFSAFIADNPALRPLEEAVLGALNLLRETYDEGGKVLICGNGGSAADAEHIVGELMKGFLKRRPLDDVERAMIEAIDGVSEAVASHTEGTATVKLEKDVAYEVLKAAIEAEGYTVVG